VSKRSIRMVAAVAGAALALGSMAPAMAIRLGVVDTDDIVDVECLADIDGLDLFPANVNVNPGDPFRGVLSPVGGLLDVGVNDNDNVDSADSAHLGIFGTGLLGTYGIEDTLDYVLGGVIDAGQCVTGQVLTCVATAAALLTPINVNVDPGHPVQTGSIFPGGLVGGLLDVGINDDDNVDTLFDGPHLGVFGDGPLGIYGLDSTLGYVGLTAGIVADCLGLDLADVLGLLACADVEGLLGRVFPVNANVNPGDPFRLFDNEGGLVDVGLNDNDNVDSAGSGHLGIFGTGLLGTYGIEDTLDHLLGDTVGCGLGEIDDLGLLSGLGGSPLGVLAPVTHTVFGLTSGVTGGLGILGGGGIVLDASILASVVAVL
jgi:hypothetical protein